MQYYDNSYTSFGDFIPLGSIHHHHQSSSSSSSWASLPHSTSTNHHQNSLHFAYQGGGGGDDPHHHHHHHHLSSIISDSTLSFPNYNINMREEMMDAKALAASKNHSEAERRRRHRINTHLSNLRSLLPNTTKTDKASLLAEVIQHVKDLKRQTSHLISAASAADDDDNNDDETTPIPTEEDELTVVANSVDDDGNLVIKASLCCQDRPDLLPDLISTLNSFSLRTLKAHITTLAGRVKHVIFFTSHSHHDVYYSDDNDDYDRDYHQRIKQQPHHYSINSIHEALKAVLEKGGGGGRSCSGGSVKRQRTNRNNNN